MKMTDDKKILRLREEGKTFEEIGKFFGISKPAAHKRYKKAMARVKAKEHHKPQAKPEAPSALNGKPSYEAAIAEIKHMQSAAASERLPEVDKCALCRKQFGIAPIESIDKNNPPAFLRKIGTGRVYAYSPFLADRGDMIPYEGPAPIAPNTINQ